MDTDQGHHRAACPDIVANVCAQVGDQPVRVGTHDGTGKVQAGLFHIGRSTAQLGVVFLCPALLLTGALYLCAGRRHLADGLVAGGLGAFQTAH
ncbi:hypothetical protein D3C75_968680 [compost metagenome]